MCKTCSSRGRFGDVFPRGIAECLIGATQLYPVSSKKLETISVSDSLYCCIWYKTCSVRVVRGLLRSDHCRHKICCFVFLSSITVVRFRSVHSRRSHRSKNDQLKVSPERSNPVKTDANLVSLGYLIVHRCAISVPVKT